MPFRVQLPIIAQDLDKKLVLLTGPRQVGKTTLSKALNENWKEIQYLNFDAREDRDIIQAQTWNRQADLVILDEVHKQKQWKNKLKGIYDTEGVRPRLLVTGSARLDSKRRGGDSLAGRYFLHRLYPFSIRELEGQGKPQALMEQLLQFGGFPEPLFSQSNRDSQRWRKNYLDRILREDILDLEPIKDIRSLLLLVELLRHRVGSTISIAGLARDLEVSPHTVKRWIQILEQMYVVFTLQPYHRNIARAILKEPKIYFYDVGAVESGEGARLENLVALSMRKWLHFLEDSEGQSFQMNYLRDKEKREVDFVVSQGLKLRYLVEVKQSEEALSPSLLYYSKKLKAEQVLQVVGKPIKTRSIEGIQVQSAADWMAKFDC